MSRTLAAAAVLLLGVGAAGARPVEVDLDKPGALEALERERPAHHQRVLQEISDAQVIHVDEKPSIQKADLVTGDPRRKGVDVLLPTNPAKKRLLIDVDGVVYRVTARMTERPAKLEKAR